MRKLLLLAALGGAMALSACASGGYYGAGYGYNSAPSDVWYDGYYGPYNDGYWGSGGAFYFRGMDGHFYRDGDGHFRTQAFGAAQHFNARHR